MHANSLGSKQLIRPKQVNLMTAGRGISIPVAPDTETKMHAAQLWIALPDDKRNMGQSLSIIQNCLSSVRIRLNLPFGQGDFLDMVSPVQVHTPLVGVDLTAQAK